MKSVWDRRLRSRKPKASADYSTKRTAILTLLDAFNKYCQLTIEEAIEEARNLAIEETNHHVVYDIKLERALATLQKVASKRWEEHVKRF